MMLEDATHEAFGYYATELSYGSAKPILAACELCGKFRILRRESYRTFCISCANKGNNGPMFNKHQTEETKALISAANKGKTRTEEQKALMSKNNPDRTGEKNPFFGKHHTEESKTLQSKNHPDMKGEKNSNYKDGKKASKARSHAKRRELGSNILIPLKEGEEGHHVTDECIIGIPKDVHNTTGGSRERHRLRVFEWLKANDTEKYEMILRILNKI